MPEPVHQPRVACRPRRIEHRQRCVVQPEKGGVVGRRFELRACDDPEHPNRVVRCRAPERVVELAEHTTCIAVPAPPQIDGEFVEAVDSFGKRRKTRVAIHSRSAFQPSNFHPSNFQPSNFHPSNFHPSNFHPSNFHPSNFKPSNFEPSSLSRTPAFTSCNSAILQFCNCHRGSLTIRATPSRSTFP